MFESEAGSLDEGGQSAVALAVASRHRLSVAYVTLSVEQPAPVGAEDAVVPVEVDPEAEDGDDAENRTIVAVDAALARTSRLIVRGQAGSGKTTLLQWVVVRSASQTFEEPLADWNDTTPFFIRLRQCAQDGLPASLDSLEGYRDDSRLAVTTEFLRAWDSFERDSYARRVLTRTKMELNRAPFLSKILSLKNITSLQFWLWQESVDLELVALMTNLTHLILANEKIRDLSPLASLTNLTKLDLTYCLHISDLSPLASLTNLTTLNLNNCHQVSDLRPLSGIRSLSSLNLRYCTSVKDLTPLESLPRLKELHIYAISPDAKIPSWAQSPPQAIDAALSFSLQV